MRVGTTLLPQRLVHGDHGVLRSTRVQTAVAVPLDGACFQQPRPLDQLRHVAHGAGDAVNLQVVVAGGSAGAQRPA